MNAGTLSTPMLDEEMRDPVTYDIARGVYVPFSAAYNASWDYSRIVRANKNVQLSATLYKDELFGLAHEIKAGLEFSKKKATSVSGFPQNYEVFRNFTDPLIDLGEGLVVPPAGYQLFVLNRENRRADLADQASGYLQDTITKGRFTLQLGLRYDRQRPSTGPLGLATTVSSWTNIFSSDSIDQPEHVFPSPQCQRRQREIPVEHLVAPDRPELGPQGRRPDRAQAGPVPIRRHPRRRGQRAAASRPHREPGLLVERRGRRLGGRSHGDPLEVLRAPPRHAERALRALRLGTGASRRRRRPRSWAASRATPSSPGTYQGFDWANRSAINYDNLTTFFRSDIDPNAKNVKTSPRTREIMLSLEKELRPDLAASAAATFRRYDNFDWEKPFYPADIFPSTPDLVIDNTATWFTVAGTVPETITVGDETIDLGDAGGRPWYLPVATFPGDTPYRMVDKSTAYRTYLGLDLAVTKRLSHRWFLNASLTLQDQRVHWGDSFIDPTNQWAVDGQPYGNLGSGSGGKVSVQMYSRWLAKLSGLYQLPWGFDVSATLHAREGWKIPNYITLAYANAESWPGLYRSNTVYLQGVTKDSLPVFNNLTFRIEKKISLGTGRMVLMADVFNALNTAVVNRAYDAYLGTYYVDTEEFSANPFNRLYNEILNPRVWRFGAPLRVLRRRATAP